jgi:hypothetical protein
MKTFLFKLAILTCPVLLALVFVNYFGDAARLFDDDYENNLIELLNEGHFVTNIGNYDERLFQKAIIDSHKDIIDIAIIGSSRTMLISSDHFPSNSVYNNSVSGASIEDILAIYQLYKDSDLLPKKIVLGIDPWTFNENSNQFRWKSLENSYRRFHDSSAVAEQSNNLDFKLKELFSLSYFQSSFNQIPRFILGRSKPVATYERYNRHNTELIDGSIAYGIAYRNASPEEIQEKIIAYINGSIYGLENFHTISSRIWNELELLVSDMSAKDIEVEFFLAPYPPIVFDQVKELYPIVLDVEERVRQFATLNNIKLYGSFSPKPLEMDDSFFYDGMHCKEEGIRKILQMGSQLEKE